MRRRFTLLSALGLLAALVSAPSASAQGTVLSISPQTVTPGQTVTVTGGSFSTTAGTSAVFIRLNHRDGQVLLAGADLDSRGQLINASFPWPAMAPGNYLVLGTQTYTNGRQVAFTPGRTRVRVVAASSAAAAAGAGGGGGLLSPLPLAGGALALLLLGGLALTARKLRRTPARPALGDTRGA
jgi:hypothetical protein